MVIRRMWIDMLLRELNSMKENNLELQKSTTRIFFVHMENIYVEKTDTRDLIGEASTCMHMVALSMSQVKSDKENYIRSNNQRL